LVACSLLAPYFHLLSNHSIVYPIGYAIAVVTAILIFFIIGASTYYLVKGSAENFFVAGRSLPLVVVAMTLAAQSIDSNSLLGNVDNSYKYSFWDGKPYP
jgi:Na+/proline symporter